MFREEIDRTRARGFAFRGNGSRHGEISGGAFRRHAAASFHRASACGHAARRLLRFAHGGARSGHFADDHHADSARPRLQGVTSLLATHRIQDAFGLANFRLDRQNGRVVRLDGNGSNPPSVRLERTDAPPTKALVLREGQVYFEGDAIELLHSSDDYLKQFVHLLNRILGLELARREVNGATETIVVDGAAGTGGSPGWIGERGGEAVGSRGGQICGPICQLECSALKI